MTSRQVSQQTSRECGTRAWSPVWAGMARRAGFLLLALAAAIVLLPLIATRAAAQAPTYSVLYTFTGGADGAGPEAPLIADTAGNLYGTTSVGGNTSASCPLFGGCGVVLKLDTAGNETVIYTFTGGADGAVPGKLIRDAAGNLYGTTTSGGNTSSSCPLPYGCGVVFKLDASGEESVLYTFTGGAARCVIQGRFRQPIRSDSIGRQ